jgi:hypothetical protein
MVPSSRSALPNRRHSPRLSCLYIARAASEPRLSLGRRKIGPPRRSTLVTIGQAILGRGRLFAAGELRWSRSRISTRVVQNLGARPWRAARGRQAEHAQSTLRTLGRRRPQQAGELARPSEERLRNPVDGVGGSPSAVAARSGRPAQRKQGRWPLRMGRSVRPRSSRCAAASVLLSAVWQAAVEQDAPARARNSASPGGGTYPRTGESGPTDERFASLERGQACRTGAREPPGPSRVRSPVPATR